MNLHKAIVLPNPHTV